MIWENRKELEVWELAVLAALALLALLGLYHLIARLAYCAFGEKAKVRANEDADVRIRQDSSERHDHTKSDSVRQREAFLEEKPSLANKAAESTLVITAQALLPRVLRRAMAAAARDPSPMRHNPGSTISIYRGFCSARVCRI